MKSRVLTFCAILTILGALGMYYKPWQKEVMVYSKKLISRSVADEEVVQSRWVGDTFLVQVTMLEPGGEIRVIPSFTRKDNDLHILFTRVYRPCICVATRAEYVLTFRGFPKGDYNVTTSKKDTEE